MLRVLGVFAVAAAALAGCEEATGPVATRYLGTYQLESFNGAGLPYISQLDHTVKVEVLEGSITLDSEFGYKMTRSWRLTFPDSVRSRRSDLDGSYSVEGERIAFFGGSQGAQFGGIVNDSILTVVEPDMLIEFRRSGE